MNHRAPTIAISAARGAVDSDAGPAAAHWINEALVYAVGRVGGVPVMAPVGTCAGTAAALIDTVDALVLTGGEDVSAHGSPYRPGRADPLRDVSEQALLRAARVKRLPVLGICRGMQLLAVTASGRLTAVADHAGAGGPALAEHQIEIDPASRLGNVFGPRLQVNSMHNFAVEDPGELVAVAWAEDGGIEAIEHPSRWELGVQWHPELAADTGAALWQMLVDRAAHGEREQVAAP